MTFEEAEKSGFVDKELFFYLHKYYQLEIKHSNKSNLLNRLRQGVIPLIKDISLSQITANWLISIEKKGLVKDGVSLSQFIGYLCKLNIIGDSKLYRIYECKSSFYYSVIEGDFEKILTSAIYDDFKSRYNLEDRAFVRLLLRRCVETKSKKVNMCLSKYLDKVKLSADIISGPKYVYDKFKQMNIIVEAFLTQTDIENMTNEDVINFINSKEYKDVKSNTLLGVLVELNNAGLIKNPLLCYYLSQMKDDEVMLRLFSFKTRPLLYYLSNIKLYSTFIKKETHNNQNKLFMLNFKNESLRIAMIKYVKDFKGTTNDIKYFIENFNESIKGQKFDDISDLSYQLFQIQVEYYINKFPDINILKFLIDFYKFLLNKDYNILQDIDDTRFLTRTGLSQLYIKGYQLIPYQPFEEIPQNDRWLLSYSEKQCSSEGINSSMTTFIDFTKVKNPSLKYAIKHFIWHDNSSINTKVREARRIFQFIEYLENIQDSNVSLLTRENPKEEEITLNKVLYYRNKVRKKYNTSAAIANQVYVIRNFLKHGQTYNLLKIDNGYEYFLQETFNNRNDSKPMKDEHATQIFNYMRSESKKSEKNEIYLLFYMLIMVTELRPSNIISLKRNCLKRVGSNQYVVTAVTKTSGNELIEIPISLEVKSYLERIIKLTDSYREANTNKDINEYLFILETHFRHGYGIMRVEQFTEYLSDVCEKLSIPNYTSRNLRDRYMTKVEEFIIDQNYSDLQQNILTGHSSPTTTSQNYVDINLKEGLAEANKVTIGTDSNIDINNKIKPELEKNMLLLDSEFITTPDFIGYYEEELSRVEDDIEICQDIDDLIELEAYQLILEEYLIRLKKKNNNTNFKKQDME